MKKMFVAALISVALVTTVVFAAMLNYRTTTHTATITSSGAVELFSNEGCTQVLTNLTWGNLEKGQTYDTQFWIKNIGGDPIWIEWSLSNLPADFTLKVWRISPGNGIEWVQGERREYAALVSEALWFELGVSGSAAAGSYSWDTTFTAYDSPA